MINRFILFIFLVVFTHHTWAQTQIPNQYYKKWSASFLGGANLLQGDTEANLNSHLGVGVRYAFTSLLSIEGQYIGGRLSGNGQVQNLSVNHINVFDQFTIRGVAHLSSFLKIRLGKNSGLNPYLFGGWGYINNNIAAATSIDNGIGVPLRTSSQMIALGGGLKVYLSKHIDLKLEYQQLTTQSDLIDGYHIDQNDNTDDGYGLASAGIVLKLTKRNREHIDWKYLDKTVIPKDTVLPQPTPVDTLPLFVVNDTLEIIPAPVDTIVEDTLPAPPQVPFKPLVVFDSTEHTYFIIGGSFLVESNAIRFNKSLIKLGYSSEIRPKLPNGFHRVTYGRYETEAEAQRAFEAIQRKIEDTWILIR